MTDYRVADIIADDLHDQQIDIFFMLTGGDPALWTALQRRDIKMVPCRSEQGAVYMADGYARVTGRPTFVYGQHGPGSANVAASLADAYWAMSPVVSLTSSVPAATRHLHEYQLLDQLAMHRPITHWVGEALRGDHVSGMLNRAMHEAVSAPGPTHIDVPRDIIATAIDGSASTSSRAAQPLIAPQHRQRPDDGTLTRLAEALATSRRLLILAGSGARVSQAWDAVVALAEQLDAPVVTSIGGKGTIADSHELSAGVIGRYASSVANELANEADTVLVLGSHLGSVTTDSFGLFNETRILQVDVNSDSLRPEAEVAALGDVRATSAALLSLVGGQERDVEWVRGAATRAAQWRKTSLDIDPRRADASVMDPREVISAVAEALVPTDIVVADTGYMAAWAGVLYPVRESGPYFLRAAGSLGWAIPGALGAKLASPDQRVVCITGDGGAGYNIAELETAARMGIDVTIVVVNNGTLAFEYHLQKYVEGNVIPSINDFSDIDYSEVARGLGAHGELVRTADDLAGALRRAAERSGPTLIDARVDRESIAPVTSYAADLAFPTTQHTGATE